MPDKASESALRRQIQSIFILLSAIQLLMVTFFNLAQWLAGDAFRGAYIAICLAGLLLLGVTWWLNQVRQTRLSALAYLFIVAEGVLLFAPLQSSDQTLIFFALGTFAASYVLTPIASFLFVPLACTVYTVAYLIANPRVNYSYISLLSLLVLAFASWLTARVFERARKQMRTSLEKQQARFEHLPVGWYQTDRRGQILAANSALVRMLGYPTEESFLSVNMAAVYVDQRARQEWHKKIDSEGICGTDVQWRRYDGVSVWVHENVRAVRGGHGQIIGYEGTVEDIAARKQSEEELQRRVEVMTMLYGTTRDLVAGQKVSSLMQTLAQRAVVLAGAGHSRIYLCDLDGKNLELAGSTDSAELAAAAAPLSRDQEIINQVVQTRKLAVVDGYTLSSHPLSERDDVRTGARAAIPMFHNERLLGVLIVDHTDPLRKFTDQDVRASSLFANHAAAAVDNARHLEKTLQNAETLNLLSLAATSLQDCQDVLEYLRTACNEFQKFGKFAFAFLRDSDGSLKHIHTAMSPTLWNAYHAAFGEKQPAFELSMSAVESIWKQLKRGQAVCEPGFWGRLVAATQNGSNSLAEWMMTHSHRCTTWLLPLIGSDAAMGLLVLVSERADPSFISAFSLAAQSVSSELENVRRADVVKHHVAELETFRDTDTLANASTDLHTLSSAILDQITTQLKVDAADVLALDPDTQMLNFVAGRGFRTRSLERTHLRIGEGLAGRAARKRRMIRIGDLAKETSRFARSVLVESEGFVTYIGAPLLANGQVKGVIEIFHRAPLALTQEWQGLLTGVMARFTVAVEDARFFQQAQQRYSQLAAAYDSTLVSYSQLMELCDHEPMGHTQRVTNMTVRLAREMGLKENEIVDIWRGAVLHDIGKIGIPDAILLSPNPLTSEEWNIVRTHPQIAYDILSPISYLKDASMIPYCHHERWDGSGYPRGLREEQIPLSARIFAVVDIWDALTSDRPYRAAWDVERTRNYIRSLAGTRLDPQVVEAFLRMPDGLGVELPQGAQKWVQIAAYSPI